MFYWIPPEKKQKFDQAMKDLADVYAGHPFFASDMLVTISKNRSFLSDARFIESFRSTATDDREKSLVWRLHVLAWAADHASHLSGDFVECGVWNGFSSAVICKYLDFEKTQKTFYLYDTFAGLPNETSTEGERRMWNPGYSEDPSTWLAAVRKTFAKYPKVKIIAGIVPESFKQGSPETIAYLHIDMNSARAEILALEHLFDRVVPGGLIVLDDFGWLCNREQALAELDFMRARNYSVLELPTGQGLVLKR